MQKIHVIGYPRSGTTWAARLLGDCLQCNITGWAGSKSLASEGEDRINVGKYLVTQGHATPKGDDDLTQASFLDIVLETLDDKIIFVVRDPRSIAVSAKHYWREESIFDALVLMQNGLWPFTWGNGWENFMRAWEKHADYITVKTSYEALHSNAEIEMGRVLKELGCDSVKPLSIVVERQNFVSRTKRAKEDETLSYTPEIQQDHLRGGRIADWRHEFTLEDAALAHEIFWPIMHEYGYENDENWWRGFEPMLRADEVTYAVWG